MRAQILRFLRGFTAALLRHIHSPGLEVEQMMKRVRLDVLQATNGRQAPRIDSGLIGDVYLARR